MKKLSLKEVLAMPGGAGILGGILVAYIRAHGGRLVVDKPADHHFSAERCFFQTNGPDRVILTAEVPAAE